MAKKYRNVRIGVFGMVRGVGFVKHLKKIKGVKIVSICERNDETIEKAKQHLPEDTKIFKDFDEFIDSGLDAVILANNFHEHAEFAIKALEKKIHVLSETTAAPTLGDCVKLCRAVEKSKCKYMLAANVTWTPAIVEMKKLYKEGKIGNAIYGEAEYLHPFEEEPTGFNTRDKNAYTHWRKHLPRTYYNMHTLGVLMEVTESLPVKVSGKACFAPNFSEKMGNAYTGDVSAFAITEMDNGAVFTTTGASSLGPLSKWFRLAGDRGNVETLRFDSDGIRVDYMKWAKPEGFEEGKNIYYPEDASNCGIFTEKEVKYADLANTPKSAHTGFCDFFLTLYFIKYLRGEVEPFYNVYRACALSAAAILSWRSILNNGKEYLIPDFSDKRKRRKYENDFSSPFPDENGNYSLPSSSKDYNLFKKYNID